MLQEVVLEADVRAAGIVVIVELRVDPLEFVRLVHEGLAVVALRVLLHCHHGEVGLDLDGAANVLGSHRGGGHGLKEVLPVDFLVDSRSDRIPHLVSLLHRLMVVLTVSEAHWLVDD